MLSSTRSCVLDMDVSFDMERLFDHYNFDHIPTEKRLSLFKQRDLAHVKYYKAAVKIFGGPSKRTRVHIAPPMKMLLKHRFGTYVNEFQPQRDQPTNRQINPPSVRLQTKETIAGKEEEEHLTHYNKLIAERKQLRNDLDNLVINEVYLARKINKSEMERRVQAQYHANRLQKPEVSLPVENVPTRKLHLDIPNLVVPPTNGLQLLDVFLSLNHIRLMDLFHIADKNKNWSLTRQEFFNAVAQTDISLAAADVDAMFVMLDTDLDGKLSYQDLNKGLQLWHKQKRFAESQSDEKIKKSFGIKNTSEGYAIRATASGADATSKPALKTQSKGIRNYVPPSSKQRQEIGNSRLDTVTHYKESVHLSSAFEKQNKENTLSSHEVNTQEIENFYEAAMSPLRSKQRNPDKSHFKVMCNEKVNNKYDTFNHVTEADENSRRNDSTSPEQSLHFSVNTRIFSPNVERRVSARTMTSPNVERKVSVRTMASPNSVINEDHGSPLMKEPLRQDAQILRNVEADMKLQVKKISSADKINTKQPKIPSEKDTPVNEARPGSHKSSSHSRTSTPSSLELPPADLRMEARIPTSLEEEVDIRKHDRVVLRRNKIRRQLTPDQQTAFDELPGVIKVGYKPIDDHCSESTLGGPTADVVNQFRHAKLKEYFNIKKLFEQRGLPFTQKLLDRVILYPGDQPLSQLKGTIDSPVGQLTDKKHPFTKLKSVRGDTNHWKLGALDKKSGFASGKYNNLKRNVGGAGDGFEKEPTQRKTLEHGQRQGQIKKGHSYPTIKN